MNRLQEQELLELENVQQEEREGFFIDDLSKLTWAMRKLSALQAKIKEVNDLVDVEIVRYQKWAKKETESFQRDVDFFTHKITEYHERVLAENPKEKSIKTAIGTVKSTTRKASIERINEQSLLEYAKATEPEFVKVETTEKIDWSNLKKKLHIVEKDDELIVVDDYGTIVDGVTVKPQTTTFKVEVE